MNVFRVLNANNPVHYALWLKVWLSWSFGEVFAHPDYAMLFTRIGDYAQCAIMESVNGVVLLPIILRPLCIEEWAEKNNSYYDLATPYGFGGPYVKGECDMTLFWRKFDGWAQHTGIISAFFRLSPFVTVGESFTGHIEATGWNVIRSLQEGKENIWKNYNPKVRCNTRRAEREGVRVEIDEQGARLHDFMNIYYGTMQRRSALTQYYFSEDFFQSIVKKLQGQFIFFHGIHGEKVVSTELVLLSQDNLYAFLGGTDQGAFSIHPNELLKQRIITWGIEQGKKTYVLGGGYQGNDGILRYKKEFAPQGVVPFEVGKRIYDSQIYEMLCEQRKNYEVAKGQVWDAHSPYFPLYRANSIPNKE